MPPEAMLPQEQVPNPAALEIPRPVRPDQREVKTPTVREGIEEFLHIYRACRSDNTANWMRANTRKFLEWKGIADRQIHTVSTMDMADYFAYLRTRQLMSSSINLARTTLITVWKYFRSRRWAYRNVVKPIAKYPETFRDIPELKPEQEKKILKFFNENGMQQLSTMFIVAVETGLRSACLYALQYQEIQWGTKTKPTWIHIPAHKMKKRSELHVPISDRAASALMSWCNRLRQENPGKPIDTLFSYSRQAAFYWWTQARKLAGLARGFRWHDLRKVFLTRCRRRGVPIEVAMRLSGHKSITACLLIYRAVAGEDMERAVSLTKIPQADLEVFEDPLK